MAGWGAVSALALAAGCVGGGDGGHGTADRSEGAPLRVALLTAGPVSDAGWYAGAYEGLLALRDTFGAEISHQQTRTPGEYDEAFFSYASAGYDLIFAHGFEYQDAAIRAGERFPDVTIVVSAGGRVSDNVVPLIFQLEEGSYLAGMVAGAFTRTGRVGMVGGVKIPPAEGTWLAFEAGARAERPDVAATVTWIGSWDDVAAAKEAALALIEQGADVIIHNTDAASFGVFQAVREARERGREVWALGMNRDQNAVAPDVILGSAVIRIAEAFVEITREWRAGRVGGAPYFAGYGNGVVDFVPNPEQIDAYPPDLLQHLDAARRGLADGSLEIPRVRFVEGAGG